MSKYYKRVEIDSEGNSAEPVNFVGVHPLNWHDRKLYGNSEVIIKPDAGFVEAEAYEKEFVEWCILNTGKAWAGKYYVLNKEESFNSLDELHEYYQRGVK